jgi:hypothetical protein
MLYNVSWLRMSLVATGLLSVAFAWRHKRRVLKAFARENAGAQQSAEPAPAPAPAVAMTVRIAHDNGEASKAIASVVSTTVGEPTEIVSIADTDTSQLSALSNTCWIFVVEVDREGDSPAGRKLAKALKAHDGNGLKGAQVAVLALARSVCSFSAASGGMDKFRGGARLQSALVAAGASPLCQMGCAEVEMEEVEVSVVPWAKALATSVRGARD